MRWLVSLLGFVCQAVGTVAVVVGLVLLALQVSVPQPPSAANAYYFVGAFVAMGASIIWLGKRMMRLRPSPPPPTSPPDQPGT